MPALIAIPLATLALFGGLYVVIAASQRLRLPTPMIALAVVALAILVLVGLAFIIDLGLHPMFYEED